MRKQVAGAAHVITARAAQVRETRDALVSARDSLAATKQHKLVALSHPEREGAGGGVRDRRAAAPRAPQLGAQIRAAQARPRGGDGGTSAPSAPTPSSGGWSGRSPGPITSPFGWRWGRMHEGIDLGAAYGTPIRAAASGTVIYCGWESGYGNLTVIDHGGNLATAYGHQSSIAVSCGQTVAQGQVIGYVGSTGHSTGPHLHFEVRVNGNPVDPLDSRLGIQIPLGDQRGSVGALRDNERGQRTHGRSRTSA